MKERWTKATDRFGRAINGYVQHSMTVYAAAVSFWAMVGLVPLLAMIVFGTAIFIEPDAVESFLNETAVAVPGETVDFLVAQIRNWVQVSTGISTVGLIIAVVITAWGASSGVSFLMKAINAAFGFPPRTYTRRRARAIAQTVAVLLLVVPAVVLVAVLPGILATAGAATWVRWTLGVLRWPLISLMFLLLLSLLYWAAPNTSRSFRFFTPGVGTAVTLLLAVSGGFSLYVANVEKYDSNYGTLGTIVITMLWIYISTSAVLFGAEVDAAEGVTDGPSQQP